MSRKRRAKDYSGYFKEIPESEKDYWKPVPKTVSAGIFQAFLDSDHEFLEIDITKLPPLKHRGGTTTKQDAFASAFYSWRKKKKTEELFRRSNIETIKIIRRGERVALRKKHAKKR